MESNINCVIQYFPFSRDFNIGIFFFFISDPTLNCFKNTQSIKDPPNLSNFLVKASLSLPNLSDWPNSILSGNYRCGRCVECNFTHNTTLFSHPGRGGGLKVPSPARQNVIYMLKCRVAWYMWVKPQDP